MNRPIPAYLFNEELLVDIYDSFINNTWKCLYCYKACNVTETVPKLLLSCCLRNDVLASCLQTSKSLKIVQGGSKLHR